MNWFNQINILCIKHKKAGIINYSSLKNVIVMVIVMVNQQNREIIKFLNLFHIKHVIKKNVIQINVVLVNY